MSKFIYAAMITMFAGAHAHAEPASITWEPATLGSVAAAGELGHRLRLSYQRLEAYTPKYTMPGNDNWPGDREGRAILGQVLTAQAMRAPSHQADALVAAINAKRNERGYLGPVLPATQTDEQTLSGHSWLLRGLVEYHRYRHDDVSLQMVRDIVNNLLLPSRALYELYPISAKDRPNADRADESVVGAKLVEGWRLSSDIGCAFIMLDGATSAYELIPSPALKELIEVMIKRFSQIDLQGVKAQTHASLSAARAILRFAQTEPSPALVALAEKVFETYKSHGMTDHFANDNWFGRPVWTEGCAIIDSFEVAMMLFKATDRTGYLDDAQNIYFNAIGFNQRPNGGFGCDTCPGSDGKAFLRPHKQMFEAPYCCSMRGGEGIAHATTWLLMHRGDEVALTSLQDFKATLPLAMGKLELGVTTGFPFKGHTRVAVNGVPKQPVTLKVFVPSWVESEKLVVKIDGKKAQALVAAGWLQLAITAKQVIEIEFPITLRTVAAINATKVSNMRGYRHGPLVLGVLRDEKAGPLVLPDVAVAKESQKGRYRFDAGTLEPITGVAFLSEGVAKARSFQILFPTSPLPQR